MRKISDFMTRGVASAPPGTPLGEAVAKMLDQDVGSVIIVDGPRDPRGILTRDLTMRAILERPDVASLPVGELDLAPVQVVSPEADVREGVDLILQPEGSRHVVVVGEVGVEGIFTPANAFEAVATGALPDVPPLARSRALGGAALARHSGETAAIPRGRRPVSSLSDEPTFARPRPAHE
ncbi:MAG: CBS domain-containing protein [Chloroflexi bacterium]|nr:CBS domain-containing protein [Chloroflexota bacterium]MBU1748106.1 CBS domain-containing protein [Chloroflexota bacterium]MBU1880067.1 CBS domain-containing protein [Chloroflexota bacterium]